MNEQSDCRLAIRNWQLKIGHQYLVNAVRSGKMVAPLNAEC
jgi:uncharacterized protein (UPF0179 family)